MIGKSNKPTLCLNMIVKDEAHVIQETLECVSKYIDYYVISDTGSTDGTPDVITNFFNKKNIPGEIYHDKWVNFGYNRSLALKECLGKSKYIWIIDADDIVIGDFIIPKLTKDAYSLIYGDSFTYHRLQIFRNSPELGWRYEGVVHEYPTSKKNNFTKDIITGKYYIDSRRLGSRSKDPKKYLRDAQLLEEDLIKNPNNDRSVFYLAQSYFDYGDISKGIENYRKRIKMGGWYEEVFYSYYRVAKGLVILERPWEEIESAYLDAYNYCKFRAEPIYEIAKYYRLKGDYKTAYKWAKLGSNIQFPKQCVLFVFKDIYDYKMLDELAINAFYLDNFVESYQLFKRILEENKCSDYDKNRIMTNLKLSKEKLALIDKKICLLFVDEIVIDTNHSLWKLADDLSLIYKVCIIGNKVSSNSEYLCMTTNDMYECIDKMNFDLIILYNNLNLLIKKSIKCTNIVLYQSDIDFKLVTPKGIIITLTNSNYLNKLLKHINNIVCSNISVCNSFKSQYNINDDSICVFDATNFTQQLNKKNQLYVTITNSDITVNGFEYKYPNFFKNNLYPELAIVKKKIQIDILKDTINFMKDRIEPQVHLIQYYLDEGDYDIADNTIEKCINVVNKDLSNYSTTFLNILTAYKAKCLYYKNKYRESFNICNEILKNDNLLDGIDRWFVEDIRDMNIKHIENDYLKYPEEKIKNITKRLDKRKDKDKKIILSITTCKRYDLFEKTINSFINCCKDLNMIDCWLCVDDNSSEEDRYKMKEHYPFFTYIFKDETQKGHCISMNIIYDYIIQNKSDYLLHMEDDWHYIEERDYVLDCIRILKSDNTIGQVLFNKNYAEVEPFKIRIAGGFQKSIKNTNYYLHEYYQSSTPEYKQFMERNKLFSSNAYWPHFSFRPSILRCNMLQDIGVFYQTPHFEMEYAKEYINRGYKSAFLNTFSCIHIGKKTWERTETNANAYNLNKTDQFTISNNIISINVLSSNFNNWKKFKSECRNKLPHIIKHDTCVDWDKYLSPDEIKIFTGNLFNYRRDVLLKLLKHIEIWNSSKCKYTLILDETVSFTEQFLEHFKKLLQFIETNKYDVIYFDNLEDAYIITDSGRKLLQESVNIKTTISDYIHSKNLRIYKYHDLLFKTNSLINLPNSLHDDTYMFYSQVDSSGYDIEYYANKTVYELKQIANSNPKCVGFNTLGWIKYEIKSEDEFIHLPYSNKLMDGLYVKKN